jgi:hypothetical protein
LYGLNFAVIDLTDIVPTDDGNIAALMMEREAEFGRRGNASM